MGTHTSVLCSESNLMNNNMTGFRLFSKIFSSLQIVIWTKVASALKGLVLCNHKDNLGIHELTNTRHIEITGLEIIRT